jgi:predicted NBD/HSP70 family sugar kinase
MRFTGEAPTMSRAVAAAEVQRAPGRARAFASTVTGVRRLGATPAEQVAGSNLVCVRDHNQLLVLHAVRTRGALTRRELSGLTGLTFQTIENISRRLIAGGILEDVPPPALTSRARQLVLRAAGAHAVGIEVAVDGCRVALCDLGGRTLGEQWLSLCATGLDSSLEGLALAVQDLIDDAEVPVTTVVAVGLAATGSILDAASATGASAQGARRRRERLRDGLERRLRMPVLCTSDVIAAARGEQWSGRIFSRDFVYVHLASEIGCAVISRGQLCTGARGRGGDIAHAPAVIDGELCDCGRRGCLRTVLAEQALRRAIATSLGLAEPPTLDDISRRAASDAGTADVLERVASHLADTLLPAVQLLDPEIVMIGGPVADALGGAFCSVLERRVADPAGGEPGPVLPCAPPGAGGAASAARGVLYEMLTPAMDHLVLDTVAV